MKPFAISIIALSVVAQVQLSSCTEANDHTSRVLRLSAANTHSLQVAVQAQADAEAAGQTAKTSLAQLEQFSNILISNLHRSGAVITTVHNISDTIEKVYADNRTTAIAEFDTILASVQKRVAHLASGNISAKDAGYEVANLTEQLKAADHANKLTDLRQEETRDFRHRFRLAKRQLLDDLKERRQKVNRAVRNWKKAAKQAEEAKRKAHMSEHQYEHEYGLVEHESERISEKAETLAEGTEDQEEAHFDIVEDALFKHLEILLAKVSEGVHHRNRALSRISDSVEVSQSLSGLETKLSKLQTSVRSQLNSKHENALYERTRMNGTTDVNTLVAALIVSGVVLGSLFGMRMGFNLRIRWNQPDTKARPLLG